MVSVANQTYPDIEHVIVDGGSKDRTMEIVQEFRDQLGPVISEPDKGLYDAMNKGVQAATGDVIGILNSDDFYETDDAVQAVMDAFGRQPDLDIVFGNVVFVAPEDLSAITRFYRAGHFRPWKLRFGWMPPHPATFVRREAYEACGQYRLDFKIAADYEMFVRWLAIAGLRYQWVNKVIVRMRAGGVSTSGIKSSLLLNREIVRACLENGIYTNLALVMTKLPFKLMELWRKSGR